MLMINFFEDLILCYNLIDLSLDHVYKIITIYYHLSYIRLHIMIYSGNMGTNAYCVPYLILIWAGSWHEFILHALQTGKFIEKDYLENMGQIRICRGVCDSKFKSY